MTRRSVIQQFNTTGKKQKGYASKWNAMLSRRLELGIAHVPVKTKEKTNARTPVSA